MTLTLIKASPRRFQDCIDFILPREHRCVTLTSHLLRAGEPYFLPDSVKELEILEADGSVLGLLLLTKTGILLHCIDENVDAVENFALPVRQFLSGLNIRCIIGSRNMTVWLESLLVLEPTRSVDYRLMTLESMPPEKLEALPALAGETHETELVQGRQNDAEKLLSLQEGYEKEEVMPPGDPFNRHACLENLSRALGSQIIFFVRHGTDIVAKAGTNARGIAWDQLGGVYTAPLWRSKGLATALVAHIARSRMQVGRKVALFVKLSNKPALKAYTKAGFKPDIGFRISYF